MSAFCRDCLADTGDSANRCKSCGSHRILAHVELGTLSIAHLDCDAFYAAIEKRDDPSLLDKPVIVGGARRGVVSTACYVARIYGVRSAMPMFQARRLCPHAIVIKPNMAKYVEVARSGPAHAPHFVMQVVLEGYEPESGEATSKRAAEQAAAQAFLTRRIGP